MALTRTERRRAAPQDRVVIPIGKRRPAVLEVIGAARERLLFSVFRCTDFKVLDGIADALNRGVKVRMLLTPRAKGWEKKIVELSAYLESMGAEVRRYSDMVVKYHAKYILADKGPALVTSMNLTEKCFSATCDFMLITHDPGIVAGLEDLFECDWLAPHSTFPKGITDRLIIGPDRARAQFTAMLEGAQKSIRMIDHKANDPAIMGLLKAKRAAGLDVRILGQGEAGGLLSHGKLLIVDGREAAFGSMTLSALSLDFRREVSVKVQDHRCVRELVEFFDFLAEGGQIQET